MSLLRTIVEWGGVVMIPLLVCSVLALAVFLERVVALRTGKVIPRRLRRMIREGGAGDVAPDDPALASPLGRVVGAALAGRSASREEAIESMQMAARQAAGRLERGLVILEIIVGIAPLLGLLGTVLGLLHVFRVMGVQGDSDILAFARGIGEALWTTVVGLMIAVPTLVVHRYLQRRVETLMLAMEELAYELVQKKYPLG